MSLQTSYEAASLHDLDYDQIAARLAADGLRPAHALPLWRSLYRELAPDPRSPGHPPPLRRWLDARLGSGMHCDVPAISAHTASADGVTDKLLLRLGDRQEVETVVMGYPGRTTACLSTQAGCAMGCVFCATGQMGFIRNLRPGEIVAQVLAAQRLLRDRGEPPLRNLVLMGMGEPLQNYDAVIHALRILSDRRGLNIGPSRISISTVGVVPGIRRLADEGQPYNLAVSLHAASDAERSALVPANARWPLSELRAACRDYSLRTGRRIFFGWTLIAGRNDRPEDARQVIELLRGLDGHLNLIRLNSTPGFPGESSDTEAADRFRAQVRSAGIPCTLRQYRGIDVGAGCGQLRTSRRRSGPRSAERDGAYLEIRSES
ncbi:MAG: 23S rRNA (adenine(2503)-C(2))-methyltransferase RlmN [Verrucomicrobiae bacterium]|nr:23S rRNA (adenine(2503)-C(2))-methyltransferase RlmN [Verrucomicrobiae bacterium]